MRGLRHPPPPLSPRFIPSPRMLNEIQKEILRAFLDHDGQLETLDEVFEKTDERSDQFGSREVLKKNLDDLVREEYVLPERQDPGPTEALKLEGPFRVNEEEVERLISGEVL